MKLTITDLSKSYGSNLALDRVSLELTPGIYAILGPNGSGKSTLMNILTDNLKADSGEIHYTDEAGTTRDVRKMGMRFLEQIGFMPQYPGLYPNFTVERFMWYMAALKGMKKADAKKQIADILSAVELDDVPKRKLGALSGGMKQRLALAQAVLGDPKILILDEPTAGLDPKQRIAIRNYIAKIALNKIVLIATHVVSDIEFIAREVIMLKKGVIADSGSPHRLTQKIEGQVWILPCAPEEVQSLQNRYRVTNIAQDEASGKVHLRVLSEAKPAEDAFPAAPALEDYYLSVFGDSFLADGANS